jgi:hypothetical protein
MRPVIPQGGWYELPVDEPAPEDPTEVVDLAPIAAALDEAEAALAKLRRLLGAK